METRLSTRVVTLFVTALSFAGACDKGSGDDDTSDDGSTVSESTESSDSDSSGESSASDTTDTHDQTSNPTSNSTDHESDDSGESASESGDPTGDETGEETSDTTDDDGINPIEGVGEPTLVKDSFVFTEGPVWIAAQGKLLFTDIQADTIYELMPPSTVEVWREPTTPATNANGLALDAMGNVLACEHAGRVSRRLANGTVETVADAYMGKSLNSPNDLAVDQDGIVYFSDPSYGGEGEVGFRGVYQVKLDGTVELVDSFDDSQPNGVVLAPDERTLFVSDTTANVVRSYEIAADGTTGKSKVFAETGGGGDGMAMDVNGNLYVTTLAGILVLRPDGSTWGTLEFSEQPTNCTFGGQDFKTLYVTARTSLFAIELNVPGIGEY